MSMSFDAPQVQKYILSGAKRVAIITRFHRGGYYEIGQKVTVKAGNKRFTGRVVAVQPLTLFSLNEYLGQSGFGSVSEWLAEARRLLKAEIDPYNFGIVVVEF